MTTKPFISQCDFQQNVPYDNIKTHQKAVLYPSSTKHSFGKPQRRIKLSLKHSEKRRAGVIYTNDQLLSLFAICTEAFYQSLLKDYTYFFYKQPVYKQLAVGWQITKQISGLNPLSLSNIKKLQIKEKWSFSFVINVK